MEMKKQFHCKVKRRVTSKRGSLLVVIA